MRSLGDVSRLGRLVLFPLRFHSSRIVRDAKPLAYTLSVDPARIRQERDMLVGICPEAVQLLKSQRAIEKCYKELRNVLPMQTVQNHRGIARQKHVESGRGDGLRAQTVEKSSHLAVSHESPSRLASGVAEDCRVSLASRGDNQFLIKSSW